MKAAHNETRVRERTDDMNLMFSLLNYDEMTVEARIALGYSTILSALTDPRKLKHYFGLALGASGRYEKMKSADLDRCGREFQSGLAFKNRGRTHRSAKALAKKDTYER